MFISRRRRSSKQFSPLRLFSSGEKGAWYDPSDLTSLFQDSAGTTAVTAVEQPVGKMLDKSGNGNHATQATSAARPILRARYNLFLYSEDLTQGSVTKSGITTTTGTLMTVNSNGNAQYVRRDFSSLVSAKYSYMVTFQAGTSSRCTFGVYSSGWLSCTASIVSGPGTLTNNSGFLYISGLTSSPTVVLVNMTSAMTSGSLNFYPDGDSAGANQTAGKTLNILNADLRIGTLASITYQYITTATSYTTSGFLPYLDFDGATYKMATSSIDFTGTSKMSVFAGVTKKTDASYGTVVESSATSDSNNGTFAVFNGNSSIWDFRLKGTGSVGVYQVSPYVAAITNVLTTVSDLSASPASSQMTTRVNGSAVTANLYSGTVGSGNFGNYPLYIGSRAGSGTYLNGRIYGLVIRGSTSNSAEIANAETWLTARTPV